MTASSNGTDSLGARIRAWSDGHRRVATSALAMLALVVLGLALPAGPLASAIARRQDDVTRSRLLLEVARKHVADSQALLRTSPAPRNGDARASIERVLAQRGLRAAPSSAPPSEGRFAVVIPDAPFDDVVRAIDALARDEALHIVEATFTGLVDAGRVRAELAFAR